MTEAAAHPDADALAVAAENADHAARYAARLTAIERAQLGAAASVLAAIAAVPDAERWTTRARVVTITPTPAERAGALAWLRTRQAAG